MYPKIPSLTIFFPFYNDAGTVKKMLDQAFKFGQQVTDNLEVIALHGGNSKDNTLDKILLYKKTNPNLVVIDKTNNKEGYAVIKHGLYSATKEFVFYTDGDGQYSLESDFLKLITSQNKTSADVVNGYKKDRKDNAFRVIFGFAYATISKTIFKSPIMDMDCDFRLIKTSLLHQFELNSSDASILPELVIKLMIHGAKFSEVPVSHYSRSYGKSNYSTISLFREKLIGDIKLYFRMRSEIKKININFIEFSLNYLKNSDNAKFVKFCLVGISSVLLHFFLFNILIIISNMNIALITILSDQIPIFTSYLLNHNFTFINRKSRLIERNHLIRFLKYWIVVMTSTIFQTVIVVAGVKTFGDSLLVANIFFIIGTFAALLWNYYFHSTKIWKQSFDKL